jgi:glucose-1-phosphate thymidylyltransferase
MKVVILAAGKGIRMLPLTEKVPKVLVEINEKPFLYYVLRNLQKAGYTDFGIVVGYKKEQIETFLDKYNFKAELIEQKEQLGTGHAVLCAESFVNGEDFIVIGGDNLWGVEDLKAIMKEDNYNYISGMEVESPQHYGVLIEDNGFLKGIKEKPKEFHGFLINTGKYKFKPEIFSVLKSVCTSPRGEIELTCAIDVLAKTNQMKVIKIKSFWKDLGGINDIELLTYFLKETWRE